jgi:hypothetical protein
MDRERPAILAFTDSIPEQKFTELCPSEMVVSGESAHNALPFLIGPQGCLELSLPVAQSHFGSRSLPIGFESIGNGRHFHSQSPPAAFHVVA